MKKLLTIAALTTMAFLSNARLSPEDLNVGLGGGFAPPLLPSKEFCAKNPNEWGCPGYVPN